MSIVTIEDLFRYKKEKRKITMLTAYDAQMAALEEKAGIDLILVGDTLGMVFQGNTSTMNVAVEEIAYHTKAVCRGAPQSFIVADMPKDSYKTVDQGLSTARFLMQSGANGVKFEGDFPELAQVLKENNIPLMGHVGLLPQTAESFTVQGKRPEEADTITQAAKRLAAHGAFSIVLECVPEGLAKEISESLNIPTIGIGAGVFCDGQVLVVNDLLDMADTRKPKFVKPYANLKDIIEAAVSEYIAEVRAEKYPGYDHTYH